MNFDFSTATTLGTATAALLARLGVELGHRPVPYTPTLLSWLDQDDLGVTARQILLTGLDDQIRPWRTQYGYQAQDLVVLHPQTPGLSDLLVNFGRPHTHRDDEVRYVVDGEGLFAFFDTDGDGSVREHRVQVQAGDFVRIPAGVEHRFGLTPRQRIKAVRLFSDPAGWSAVYTPRNVLPWLSPSPDLPPV